MKMRVYAVLAQTGPLPYSVSSFTAFASSFTAFASSSDKLVFVNKLSILPPGKAFPLVKEVLFGTIAVPEVGEKRQGPGFPWGGSLFQKTPGCANVFVFDKIMPDSQANLFGIPRNIDHRQNRPSIQYSLRSVAHVCQDCKDLEDLR
jgi:hypothetical protein